MLKLCDEHRTWALPLNDCHVCRVELAAKEIALQRKIIEQYEVVVASQKEALDALRIALKQHSWPFGIPLPATPDSNESRCLFCGALGGHGGLPCPSTAPMCL